MDKVIDAATTDVAIDPAEEATRAEETVEHIADRLDEEGVAAPVADAEDDEDELEDTEDSLTYSNGVIEKIVAMATREVPHVLGMKGNPKTLPRAFRLR